MLRDALEQFFGLAVDCWPGVIAGAVGGYMGLSSFGLRGFFIGTTIASAIAMFAWAARKRTGWARHILETVFGTIGSVLVVTAITAAVVYKSWVAAVVVVVAFLAVLGWIFAG